MEKPEKLPLEPYVIATVNEALGAWGVKDLGAEDKAQLEQEIVVTIRMVSRINEYEPLTEESEWIAKITRAYVAGLFSSVSDAARKSRQGALRPGQFYAKILRLLGATLPGKKTA